ncbi:hypothetical protein Lalb_Chr12g0208031 [Lupinus albus]|uniref:Uncharacterized protein n=1 Tax=Lupinus albus TaxID=3870 RepID=A0A6A4PNV2_LUPAL|nr:hypothetical protein Lalb_Chr12g0208031 [Lupinus albus]
MLGNRSINLTILSSSLCFLISHRASHVHLGSDLKVSNSSHNILSSVKYFDMLRSPCFRAAMVSWLG